MKTIKTWPNDVLKALCLNVDFNYAGSKTTKANVLFRHSLLEQLLADNTAVGLAAPQLGHTWQIIVIDPYPQYKNGVRVASESTRIMFNPNIIISSGKKEILNEGCLSFPKLLVPVPRSCNIVVEYNTCVGELMREDFSGWAARVIQHEVDHLSGKTIINYLPRQERLAYEKRMMKDENY